MDFEERVTEGDAVRLTPEGLEPLDGVVDYVRPNFVGIRTADALYCFFGRNAFGGPVALTIHWSPPTASIPIRSSTAGSNT